MTAPLASSENQAFGRIERPVDQLQWLDDFDFNSGGSLPVPLSPLSLDSSSEPSTPTTPSWESEFLLRRTPNPLVGLPNISVPMIKEPRNTASLQVLEQGPGRIYDKPECCNDFGPQETAAVPEEVNPKKRQRRKANVQTGSVSSYYYVWRANEK